MRLRKIAPMPPKTWPSRRWPSSPPTIERLERFLALTGFRPRIRAAARLARTSWPPCSTISLPTRRCCWPSRPRPGCDPAAVPGPGSGSPAPPSGCGTAEPWRQAGDAGAVAGASAATASPLAPARPRRPLPGLRLAAHASPMPNSTTWPSPISTATPSTPPIEKRDDPSLADKPVIVGGGKRGVVSTCCYIARIYGVRSAMPMFKALAACPRRGRDQAEHGEIRRGRAGRSARMMLRPDAAGQPVSIDEAFLDLSGTERLHGAPPGRDAGALRAARRAGARPHRLGRAVLQQVPGQDRLRPRQAARLRRDRPGRGASRSWRDRPVGIFPGVGKVTQERLAPRRLGHRRRHAARWTRPSSPRRYGEEGLRLCAPRPRRGRRAGRARARDQEHLRRDDLRRGHRRSRGARCRCCCGSAGEGRGRGCRQCGTRGTGRSR